MQEPNFNPEQRIDQKAEIKESLEGLVRLAAEIFLQGVAYENYVQKVKDTLLKNYNITTYKLLTSEDESALITEDALILLEKYDPNFKSCKEKYSKTDRDILGPYVDLIEIRRKYQNQGIGVLLEGVVPIIGEKPQLDLIRGSGVDDFYRAFMDLINQGFV